jgi:hypothetical protein
MTSTGSHQAKREWITSDSNYNNAIQDSFEFEKQYHRLAVSPIQLVPVGAQTAELKAIQTLEKLDCRMHRSADQLICERIPSID